MATPTKIEDRIGDETMTALYWGATGMLTSTVGYGMVLLAL